MDWNEEQNVKKAGLEYSRLSISGPDSMTDELLGEARKLLRSADGDDNKLLCHCGSANRVGAVWLTYRVLDQGIAWDTALEEAKEVGLRSPGLTEAARQYIQGVQATK